MSRLFFTTVGTSSMFRLPPEIDRDDPQTCYNFLLDLFHRTYRENPEAVLGYSAELKSVFKAGVTKEDLVVLISTDTVQGYMCGRLLSDFLGDSVGCDVHLERVEGLQMKDAIRFKEVGLHNYLDFLFRTYHCYEASHRIIINLTGGFKGVIPYSTVAAMLLGLPIVYVFEFSDELIYLPALPLSVDSVWYSQRLERFSLLEEGTVDETVFFEGMSMQEREEMGLVVDCQEGQVRLSAIGRLVWERFGRNKP